MSKYISCCIIRGLSASFISCAAAYVKAYSDISSAGQGDVSCTIGSVKVSAIISHAASLAISSAACVTHECRQLQHKLLCPPLLQLALQHDYIKLQHYLLCFYHDKSLLRLVFSCTRNIFINRVSCCLCCNFSGASCNMDSFTCNSGNLSLFHLLQELIHPYLLMLAFQYK